MTNRADLHNALHQDRPDLDLHDTGDRLLLTVSATDVADLAVRIAADHGLEFATLVIEDADDAGLVAHYFFYSSAEDGGFLVQMTTQTESAELPAISDRVHAADWHEREAEDMFEIRFVGHPFLGDFILHDTEWPEGVAPMRHAFDPRQKIQEPGKGADWRPRRLLDEPGALAFPVGPIWGDYHESGLWVLETPGEQVRQVHSRLFYKYRGVEKIAEGQIPDAGLLLAERFSGSSAFAHGWAYCQALEKLADCNIPPRAQALRLVLGEFERMRYHAATLAELAGSTGLAVAKAHAQDIEESLLRLAGDILGHRYLFGVLAPGGLAFGPDDQALARLHQGVDDACDRLNRFEQLLTTTSSFLDRLEEMGTLTHDMAIRYGAVGPVGRASSRGLDLRRVLPYAGYTEHPPALAGEIEGDGYARMRVYFDEIRASAKLIRAQLNDLPDGPIVTEPALTAAGTALAWTEAPAGAAFHWLRLNADGCIARWQISTPSFRNWHVFHRAAEGGAFQDFPIILASFGLSAAENDR